MNGIFSACKLRTIAAFLCAVLAGITYGRAQLLPFIGDDYLQIDLARRYASAAGWGALAADALYRCRATSLFLTNWTELVFGIKPVFFNLTSLAVHMVNCLLVIALGVWRPIGWRIATAAAVFFAFLEGHHEAVVWYAALPELLVFTFTLLTFLLWVRWLQAEQSSSGLYACALGAFVLALLSKESAVCVTGLMALAVALEPRAQRRHWYAILPFGLISILYFASIYQARTHHLHFNDGTFAITAPFWSTLFYTVGRMLWPWGYLGLATLIGLARLRSRFAMMLAGWIVITLLPYSFLTYMSRVPSRHTYLASVALALLLGAATLSAWRSASRNQRQGLVIIPLLACFLQNTAYLWTRKHQQFTLRAKVTQDLLQAVDNTSGVIEIVCFPYDPNLAYLAVKIERPADVSRLLMRAQPGCKDESFVLRAGGSTIELP